jgi:pyruvate dehydrogenase phosphatase
MPTRALGDLRMKLSDFNFHNFAPDLGYRPPIPKFNGPYISAEPEISVIDLKSTDHYLILASDGLWDEVSRKKTPDIVKGKDSDLKSVGGRYEIIFIF